MSFSLAFWIGERPVADAATAEFERLYGLYVDDGPTEPRPELLAFIREITGRYPDLMDLPEHEIDDGVWSDGPLTGNASGPLLYLGLVWSRVDEVVPFLVEVAAKHRLVVYDPQSCTRLG
jgi:hypothetical protein